MPRKVLLLVGSMLNSKGSCNLTFSFGPGRDQAFKAIRASGWKIVRITDTTPLRFGGCRPRKKRSV